MSDFNLKRYEPVNHYNYTEVQKAKKAKVLKELERDFPKIPVAWAEMAYDYCENTPIEEVNKVINEKRWEGKGKFSDVKPQVIKNAFKII